LEVKEQIGDDQSDFSFDEEEVKKDLIDPNPLPTNKYVDGVVAGSIPNNLLFSGLVSETVKMLDEKLVYDSASGNIIERPITNGNKQKIKLIFSKIDEEDEHI
jgi:hypothetical protein